MFRVCLSLCVLAAVFGGGALAQENRGHLGVDLQDVTKEEADKLGWETPRGVRVVKPHEGAPPGAASLLPGDIITSLDGQDVENMERFVASIGDRGAGAQVRLRLMRGGKERTVAVTLGKQPADLAQTRKPPKRDLPILQLDTGGHTGIIRGLAFTPDGRHLVSAGEDKVIRVWDRHTGVAVRSIRGQAGAGAEGNVYAIALSADGRWLAAGGWLSTSEAAFVRLYEFATGRLVALLEGHANPVVSLAFAPDGKWLISGSQDKSAIIWDVEQRALARRLTGHTGPVYGVGFSPDSARAVTGSHDKTLKLWSLADGKAIATLPGHTDKVWSLAVSGTDGTIASGGGEIRLWDGQTGRLLRTLEHRGDVGALAFSADGKLLLSTCGYRGCDDVQRLWEIASGKELATYTGHNDIVVAAALSSDGRLVATGGGTGHEIHLWDSQGGQLQQRLASTGLPTWAAAFSADGQHIAWGNTWVAGHASTPQPLDRQLRLANASSTVGLPDRLDSMAAAEFVRARTTDNSSVLSHRKGGPYGFDDAILEVRSGGKLQATITRGSDGYTHSAYTLAPDGQSLISGGGGGVLVAYDLQGKELGRYVGHEGKVWAVTPSPDGRLLVSGSADQTVRLWNLKTRELIITLFRGADGEWVMWTPQGYYTGSPGADKIVGWQINKGPANAADHVGADQLRTHLNRPDIVDKAIILASAEQAVREAPGTSFKLADLLSKPVPRFRIVSPAPGSTQRGGRVPIKIAIEAVPDPIKAIRVHVNGRQVAEIATDIGSGGIKAGEHTLDVPLGKDRNEVRVTLGNAIGEKAETITLKHEGDGDLDKRGTLYILAIGIDRYPVLGRTCGEDGKASCDLRYSGADARALVAATERRLGPAHSKVVKRMLLNGDTADDAPTAANIIDATDLLKQAKETDTVVVFIAGHGFNDGPSYRLLATNATRDGDGFRSATVVQWQILQEALERAKGRRILFLDTCHSGNAYNQTLGNAAYHANIIAYTSARFDQEAMEDRVLGHGIFTYAVVEGLDGKGATAPQREMSTKDLARYVIKRVAELAKALQGEQEPQYFKGRDADDYILVRP